MLEPPALDVGMDDRPERLVSDRVSKRPEKERRAHVRHRAEAVLELVGRRRDALRVSPAVETDNAPAEAVPHALLAEERIGEGAFVGFPEGAEPLFRAPEDGVIRESLVEPRLGALVVPEGRVEIVVGELVNNEPFVGGAVHGEHRILHAAAHHAVDNAGLRIGVGPRVLLEPLHRAQPPGEGRIGPCAVPGIEEAHDAVAVVERVLDHEARRGAPGEVVDVLRPELHRFHGGRLHRVGLRAAGPGLSGPGEPSAGMAAAAPRDVLLPAGIARNGHARRGDDVSLRQRDRHVEGAELAVEFAHPVLVGVPAILIVDDHLGIPLGDVVLLARVARAPEKGHDLFLERHFEHRRPSGGNRFRENRRENGSVDRELHEVSVDLELLHVEPRAHRLRKPHEEAIRSLQIVLDEGGRLVAEGVRIEVQMQHGERVGGIVRVADRFGAREEMIVRVERGLDRVIGLLLPVSNAVLLRAGGARGGSKAGNRDDEPRDQRRPDAPSRFKPHFHPLSAKENRRVKPALRAVGP